MKRRARQFVLFLIISVVKNWRLSAEAIFAQKKRKNFAVFEKTKVVPNTFRLK